MNKMYEHITEPCNIREFFSTVFDFTAWLRMGSINDLKATLKAFEAVEMYEDCVLIKKVINEKEN